MSGLSWVPFVVVHGLSSCSTWAPEHRGLVVAVCRLSCFSACGILVPRPGIRPASSTLQGRFLSSGPPGKSHFLLLLMSSKAVELQETHLAHLCILERVTPSFRARHRSTGCISTPSPLHRLPCAGQSLSTVYRDSPPVLSANEELPKALALVHACTSPA